jgi:outer membrane receptor protein involved in Fe transport
VTRLRRYVSPNTDARERQWRHYYYAQDVFRPTPKVTLNYGLRLDIINPQTVNEAGNGGFLDLSSGLINVAGVGNIGLNGNVENSFHWAPRPGATYQLTEKTVLRAGYGRSFDIGVFGSLFGHSVTQNPGALSRT